MRKLVIPITLLSTILIMPLAVKGSWAWVIPDLFPGAVSQGLVAASISWLAGFKLLLLVLSVGWLLLLPQTLDRLADRLRAQRGL